MKQKSHKIEIRQRENSGDNIMTGANTEVLMDGKKLNYVTKVSFEVDAGGVAKVTLELVGKISVVGKMEAVTRVS